VQMNVEDTRLGVAEYVINKHKLDTIELKWGQGAKNIGGEIKVNTLERALELKKRGYIVLPDPALPEIKAAYKDGAIKEFERHSRLGFVTKEAFLNEVARLRKLGFKRVTLKTGAYSAVELAMAIRYGAEAELDLLTVDGAPGGTGMSPWPMMTEWGIPSFYLHSLTYQFCEELRKKKIRVPDIAFAGGFSTEDGVFKALALGAPYVKAVCMGRALMIPGMVGKNIGEWIKKKELPKSVSKFGTSIEEIFVGYEDLKKKFGKDINKLPTGALGLYTYTQKFKVGLQQLMAGSRNFNLGTITRQDVMALTEEAARISGISYVMDAYLKEAKKILSE
jgi:glutamate synthase domain-containing protein 2